MMPNLVDLLSQAKGRMRELASGKAGPKPVPSETEALSASLEVVEDTTVASRERTDASALLDIVTQAHLQATPIEAVLADVDAVPGVGPSINETAPWEARVARLEVGMDASTVAAPNASTVMAELVSASLAAPAAPAPTVATSWSNAFLAVDRVPGTTMMLGVGGAAVASTALHASASATAPDTTPPTVLVLSSTSSLKAGQTATLTFVLSESSTTFNASSVDVTGGTLSNFSGSGALYSATFTPTPNSSTPGSVSVSSGKFRDAAGNLNTDGADSNNRVDFTVDTATPVAPQIQLDGGTWAVNPQVTLQVNMGSGALQNVVVEVFPNEVSATVSNWMSYVNTGFYNGLIFHRVIAGFVAQSGGYTSDLTQKSVPYDALALESGVQGLSNVATTIAMARSSAPDSATSQFYFNLVDNASLDYSSASSPGYAVFGEVVSGWSTVQAIGNTTTSTQNGLANVPTNSITTQNVSMTQTGQAYSSTGILHLKGLEQGAQWSYSLDGGTVWTPFSQSDLNVGNTPGNKTVSIRQVDAAGNVSATSSMSFTQYTPDDLHSVLDLATSSDTAGGDAGTDHDNITQATSLDLSATVAAWANKEVWLMDQGHYVATATANGSGALSWLNINASAGTHLYTLYDPAAHVRVLAPGGVAVSELTVRVL